MWNYWCKAIGVKAEKSAVDALDKLMETYR